MPERFADGAPPRHTAACARRPSARHVRRPQVTDLTAGDTQLPAGHGTGGSPAHDRRREGTVTPPEHNLRRGGGTTSPREAKLEDPDLPHGEKSSRELRREAERAERSAAAGGEGGTVDVGADAAVK